MMLDKSVLAVIIGPLTGLLVMKGLVAPQDADMFTQQTDAVVGGLIALITIIGFISHHTEIQKAKNAQETQTAQPVVNNT